MPGEAVPKHVGILSITGREFKVETVRLKTVRPFVMKEIVLSEDKKAKAMAKKDNRGELTRHLISIVDGLIEEAKAEWLEAQDEVDQDEDSEIPLPLIRLRVEYSAPDGGNFDCENPQRFSNRFVGKVANVNDVVQFYRKKAGVTRKMQNGAELPEESVMAQMSLDSVKVEKLVRDFLTAQSLTILPQNSFGDAVSQFVDKDDKHAMEMFVSESLANQMKHLMDVDHFDEEELQAAMDQYKSQLEDLFAAGHLKRAKKAKLKPKPDMWDSDLDGEWGDQPGALILSDVENAEEEEEETPVHSGPKRRGRGGTNRNTTRTRKAPAAKTGRGKKKAVEEEIEEDNDVVMDDSNEEESALFVKPEPVARGNKRGVPAKETNPTSRRAPARATAGTGTRQSKLNFSQPASQLSQSNGKGKFIREASVEQISDDEDAFEPAPTTRSARSRA